jgi:flagellar rod assembly protein/muramidase flgJ
MSTLDTFIITVAMIAVPSVSMAQFYTVTKETPIEAPPAVVNIKGLENVGYTENRESAMKVKNPDSIQIAFRNAGMVRKSREGVAAADNLPPLTIQNLIAEIEKNGIKYPKIVLAQAILETGWFKSPVCRNKHNLFGLTNPRTDKYYEFNHWTESVKAYYTKVQYRYKGGNYLLWLKKIGYAEDPGYIRAVIRVLRQL